MLRFSIAAPFILALAGCNLTVPGGAPAVEAAARAVVGPILAEKVPGRGGQVMTDCVVENASTSELVQLGAAAIGAPSADVVLLVADILSRPNAQSCVAERLITG
ncbi:hypothetical protein [Aestuariibius sp. HNIBRBA575]|uniref:hypothetical protein n=1 Tax=Aestuariibius sp. HNIBRBA575 TaxID=3233343 RepID=UPI0034A38CE1